MPWLAILGAVWLAIWWGLRHAQASVPAVLAQERPGPVGSAVIALARMPADEASVPAARRAASAPAEAASDSLASCGGDQAAVDAEPETKDGLTLPSTVQIKPAGQGWVDATHRLDARMRSSDDPYVQAVAVALNVGEVLTPAGRVDALAQMAANSSDPRIYSLGYRSCVEAPDIPGSCRFLSVRQWAALDPGNAVPWLYAFNQSVVAGDSVAQAEALSNMASSVRFRSDFHGPAGAISDLIPEQETDLAADFSLAMRAFQLSYASMPPFSTLTTACRSKGGGDGERAQQCDQIAAMMFDHGENLMDHAIGGSLHRLATGDSSWLDQAHAEQKKLTPRFLPPTELSACGALRYMSKQFGRMAQVGELEYGRELLRAAAPH